MKYTKQNPLKVVTLCSGYDSQCLALNRLREHFPEFDYTLIAWSEFDPETPKTPLEKQPAVVAHNAGADFVKLFPVGCMGARYLKDVRSPLSHIRFLAVGGVNADNMEEYLKAGACGFGIGSDIVNKKMLAENDFAGIEALAAGYTRVVAAFNEK